MKKRPVLINKLLAAISIIVAFAFVCNSATLPLLSVNSLDVGNKIEILELTQEENVGFDVSFFSLPLVAIVAHFYGQSFLFNAQKVFSINSFLSKANYTSKYPLYILFQSLRIYS